MLQNYLLTALRNLQKQKVYSIIAVFSLALGLAVFMLGALYADYILHFDMFHRDADRIFGIVQVLHSGALGDKHTAITPSPLLPAMAEAFPEIEDASRFHRASRMIIRYKEKCFYEKNILTVDSNFLSFFTFGMIEGNPEKALSEPYTAVLTESAALKYFGDENPVGKILTLDNRADIRVTGVVKDAPPNSSIQFDFLISMETARFQYDWTEQWTVNSQAAFIRLPERFSPSRLEAKFPAFIKKYYPDSPESPVRLYLFPLCDFHLKSENITSYLYWNSPGELYSTLLGCSFFLLIVCLNFVNLSTSRHLNRAKEVGMRKVVGADRHHLVVQFLGESIIQSMLALPLAIVLFELICPAFLSFFGNPYRISLWNSPFPILFFLGVTLVVGVLAGSYPAFLLSSFRPVQVIKGNFSSGKSGSIARKILIVSQYTLAIIFIVVTVVLKKQFHYLIELDLGYDRENVVVLPMDGTALADFERMKKELVRHPGIVRVSAAAHLPFKWEDEIQVIPEEAHHKEAWVVNGYAVDYDFIETLGVQMLAGRSFIPEAKDEGNYVVNETAVKRFQWEDAVGKRLTIGGREGTVIGIAKDFHFRKLFKPIAPAVLYLQPDKASTMFIKVSSLSYSDALDYIEKQWRIFMPDRPFEFSTLDFEFEEAYMDISKSATVGTLVCIVAVVLSSLGLFGLATHDLSRRLKEIGIRKALGATGPRVFRMLNKEFLLLVIISNFVGLPIAYYVMQSILQSGYAYRTPIGAGIFVFTGILTLVTGMLAVAYQTVKTSMINPVDVLRHE